MEHEGGRSNLTEQMRHIDGSAHGAKLGRDRRRGSLATQLVEPRELLVGALGNEARGEDLPERRIVRTPTETNQLDERAIELFVLGVAARGETTGVTTVKDQTRDSLGMGGGISHARRRTLRDAEQRERLADL